MDKYIFETFKTIRAILENNIFWCWNHFDNTENGIQISKFISSI